MALCHCNQLVIANVANRLLKNTILNRSICRWTSRRAKYGAAGDARYLEGHPLASGLMILVDMGSLRPFIVILIARFPRR